MLYTSSAIIILANGTAQNDLRPIKTLCSQDSHQTQNFFRGGGNSNDDCPVVDAFLVIYFRFVRDRWRLYIFFDRVNSAREIRPNCSYLSLLGRV
jgi:hypothetical protein